MRIKTFYAKTMAEAMEEIKAALGPDALLLSTKGIPNRSGIGGAASGYEVVAAIDEEATEEAVRRLSSQRHAKAEHPIDSRLRRNSEPDYGVQNRDLVYIPNFLRRPGSNFKHGAASQADVSPGKARTDDPAASKAPEPPFEDPPSSSLYWDLLASGVDEWLARKLLSEARELRVCLRQRGTARLG